jgi:hypothetical protein
MGRKAQIIEDIHLDILAILIFHPEKINQKASIKYT